LLTGHCSTAKVAQVDAKVRSLVADHDVKKLKAGKPSGPAAMASRERNIAAANKKLLAAQQLEKECKDAHALVVASEAAKTLAVCEPSLTAPLHTHTVRGESAEREPPRSCTAAWCMGHVPSFCPSFSQ